MKCLSMVRRKLVVFLQNFGFCKRNDNAAISFRNYRFRVFVLTFDTSGFEQTVRRQLFPRLFQSVGWKGKAANEVKPKARKL